MINRNDCTHRTLKFGSGDYYLFCNDCNGRWVACDLKDIGNPDIANKGVGNSVCDTLRVVQENNSGSI